MIDIHCHILPEMDDGARSMEETIEMCRMAEKDGIKTIVATPHFKPPSYEHESHEVFRQVENLNGLLSEKGIGVKILSGADVSFSPELPTYLNAVKHVFINGGSWIPRESGVSFPTFLSEGLRSRYFLLELPLSPPKGWEEYVFSVCRSGFIPILTHPERNPAIMRDLRTLSSFVNHGGLVQITAMSITGEFGDVAHEASAALLKDRLVHVIATDAHSWDSRMPILSAAVDLASDIVGADKARTFVYDNPMAIIEGRMLTNFNPALLSGKKTWLKRLFS